MPRAPRTPKTPEAPTFEILRRLGENVYVVDTPPHKASRSVVPPQITKERIKALAPAAGVVYSVLNKACPACGFSLWWSPAPTGLQSRWQITDFRWSCGACQPRPVPATIARGLPAQKLGTRTPPEWARPLPCRGCGEPIGGWRSRCLGLCDLCVIRRDDLIAQHCRTCPACLEMWRSYLTSARVYRRQRLPRGVEEEAPRAS